MSLGKNIFYGNCCHFVTDIITSQNPLPLYQPMSAFALPPLPTLPAIVSILQTTPPPFVSHCHHFPNPPPPLLAADIICEQPLTIVHILWSYLEWTTPLVADHFVITPAPGKIYQFA